MNTTTSLSMALGKTGVTVEILLLRPGHVGLGISAAGPFEKGLAVGYYYGPLVYAKVCRR